MARSTKTREIITKVVLCSIAGLCIIIVFIVLYIPANQQRQFANAILDLGGHVSYSRPGEQAPSSHWLSDDSVQAVYFIDKTDTALIRCVTDFPSIQLVSFSSMSISREIAQSIAGLTGRQTIVLGDCTFEPGSIQTLASSRTVRRLSVMYSLQKRPLQVQPFLRMTDINTLYFGNAEIAVSPDVY